MLWKSLLRKSRAGLVLGLLLVLSACSFTIDPNAADPNAAPSAANAEPTLAPPATSGAEEATAITEFVLPDGTYCLFADTGITVVFDNKTANYTCTTVEATESTTTTLAILNDPVVIGPTEYSVDLATVAQTEGGFELHASEVISFTAWEVLLADGRVCLHAGFGATMGFDDKRLNYTCDKGASSADEVGLMGELTNQGNGVWVAQIDEIGRDTGGFTQLSSSQVQVARVSGVEVMPGGEAEATPETHDALLGVTWQWVETVYGDGTVVAADDPSRYTLLFDESGQVAVRLDCNGGGGSYMLDGSSLFFGELVSTLMACAGESQATLFAKDLAEVYSYVIEDGRLFLSLKLDSGIMEFAPGAQMAGTPTAEATEEAVEEATPEATQEATEEATEEASEEATPAVTEEPTSEPTEEATEEATAEATVEPTEEATEEATAEPTAEAPEESSTGAGSSDLAGTTWQWEQTVYEGDMVVLAHDPSRYTLTFEADGTVGVQLDCNSGGSTYTVDGPTISFGAIASTKMACLGDSQANTFAEDLAAVTSYVFADGNLHLTTSTDGVMQFAPVE